MARKRKRRYKLKRTVIEDPLGGPPIVEETKQVPVSPDARWAVEQQAEEFRRKFGRDPKPHEPLFFDPDADEPRPIDPGVLRQEVAQAAREAGLDPALIYAMEKTGLIVTQENMDLLTDEELEEWESALDEYRGLPPTE